MKVTVATPLYPPELGAPAAYVKELAQQLSAAHQVTVVAYATEYEPVEKVQLVTVSKQQPLPVRLAAFTWQLLRASRGTHVIYAQRALAAGLPASLVGWLRRVPVAINFMADELSDSSPRWRTWLQGVVLRAARRVVVPSGFMAARCRERYGVPSEKIRTCPPPLAPDQALPFQPQRSTRQVLLPAVRVKAGTVAAAIEAMPQVLASLGGAKLVVAGEVAGAARLHQLARSLGVEGQVTFLGRISRAEEWYRYRQSAACVVSLTDELGEASARVALAAGAAVVEVRQGEPVASAIVAGLEGQGSGVDVPAAPSWPAYVEQLLAALV